VNRRAVNGVRPNGDAAPRQWRSRAPAARQTPLPPRAATVHTAANQQPMFQE